MRRVFQSRKSDPGREQAEEVDVELTATAEAGFGFAIIGKTKNKGRKGVFVHTIQPGSPADLNEHVAVGRVILAVNGEDTTAATVNEVSRMLALAGLLVRVKLGSDPAGYRYYSGNKQFVDAGRQLSNPSSLASSSPPPPPPQRFGRSPSDASTVSDAPSSGSQLNSTALQQLRGQSSGARARRSASVTSMSSSQGGACPRSASSHSTDDPAARPPSQSSCSVTDEGPDNAYVDLLAIGGASQETLLEVRKLSNEKRTASLHSDTMTIRTPSTNASVVDDDVGEYINPEDVETPSTDATSQSHVSEGPHFYVGLLTKQQAEFMLSNCPDGAWLIRESDRDPGQLRMAVKFGHVDHIELKADRDGYRISKLIAFPSVQSLIDHYSHTPLSEHYSRLTTTLRYAAGNKPFPSSAWPPL